MIRTPLRRSTTMTSISRHAGLSSVGEDGRRQQTTSSGSAQISARAVEAAIETFNFSVSPERSNDSTASLAASRASGNVCRDNRSTGHSTGGCIRGEAREPPAAPPDRYQTRDRS